MHRTCTRDDYYYFDDGSCILEVEDVLFNVHKSRLSMDSSSFGTMFSLPSGEHPVEGTSDDNPIILSGDTAADFRHFLWSLYALPSELILATSDSANLDQLVAIARISQKYAFRSIENWALDAIQEYINRKPFPILPSATGKSSSHNPIAENSEQLTTLIRLAQLCNHESLLNTSIQSLKNLMFDSIQYACLAMSLADELGLRTLRGVAYLQVMQHAVIIRRPCIDVIQQVTANQPSLASGMTFPTTPPVPENGPRISLTVEQQLRLLAGYYRLTETWEELRKTPPHFDHSIACGATWHQHGCMQSWVEFWKEKTKSDTLLNLGLADVIGRLKQISRTYEKWGSATYMHHDCRQVAKESINAMIKRVEDALPDYFSDADTSK
ncbi:hypothetical protein AGABI1DRAFT_113797 [Agaricus bisporus var. burnettii JB137-S8]|uniref:BTB domain-containing protein n=2 Tax=Agaricus bisporus var. burnettii TaxID=192524 RepID=K5XVL1_AGABU|nr:uncharacterized protein AGABI1DRAFT_113797 [Agaricus bisporus var. burnettii JB137-S8]EKM79200.1 hypothetical protein AGABI1DRAFT_113797 [Agaricus bisporus var. burnettii JB137-S8]KAF7768546.1 hypothetical protein Agabi119p4_7789 [Agaricus bisporus var. burnettii]